MSSFRRKSLVIGRRGAVEGASACTLQRLDCRLLGWSLELRARSSDVCLNKRCCLRGRRRSVKSGSRLAYGNITLFISVANIVA